MANQQHYTTGKWHHYTKYRCNYCAYNTLDQDEMERHIQQRHTDQYVVRPAAGGLVTAKGQQMHVVDKQPAPEPPRQHGQESPTEPEDAPESDKEARDPDPSSGF